MKRLLIVWAAVVGVMVPIVSAQQPAKTSRTAKVHRAAATVKEVDAFTDGSDGQLVVCALGLELAGMLREADAAGWRDKLEAARTCPDSAKQVVAPEYSTLRKRIVSPAAKEAFKAWYAYWLASAELLEDRDVAAQRQVELLTLARKVSVEF